MKTFVNVLCMVFALIVSFASASVQADGEARNITGENAARFSVTDAADKNITVGIVYEGNNATVITAAEQARQILANQDFYDRITAHQDFSYTDESPRDISQWIRDSNISVTVRLYLGSSGSSTLAYVDPRFPNTIFLNSRKLDRATAEIANTIIHESVHSVDGDLPNARFGHGDNRWQGKGNSAPYWIGNLAERILNGEKSFNDNSIIKSPVRRISENFRINPRRIVKE